VQPTLLAGLRDRLLGQVLRLLEADLAVDGVALVDSLGRGEEDNWSDRQGPAAGAAFTDAADSAQRTPATRSYRGNGPL
jgi:hypothetical protein